MGKYVPDIKVNEPARKTGGIKKSVATVKSPDPEREVGSMRKSVAVVRTSDPMHEALGMRKNALTISVPEPPEETGGIDKAEIPVQGSSMQHIGGWKGMNKRATFDSGALSEAVNVSFKNFPNVESVRVAEVVKKFTFTEYTSEEITDEEGNINYNIVSEETGINEVYDCVARGDEIFLACDKGYVYGRMIDGKFRYISIGESHYHNTPTEKTRLTFVETYSTGTAVITVKENACVFSTFTEANDGVYLPVLPVGSIEFVDNFTKLLWGDQADISKIYCVCDETGKAVEVWRNFVCPIYCEDDAKTLKTWVEMRRHIMARYSAVDNKERVFFGYWKKNGNSLGKEYYEDALTYSSDSGMVVGYFLSRITSEDTLAEVTREKMDEWVNKEGTAADDDIGGIERAGLTEKTLRYPYGIFNYIETVAPEFENVTFYKGRVFGNVGSTVICSEHNDYNGWITGSMSADAWMTTTTANANADGSIVAMKEYLGKISVLKSGFMQEVYGGSNPFTIQDVYAVGTPFKDGVCEAYGKLCFAGRNALRTYGGGFPKVIGDELGIDTYEDVQMLGNDRSVLIKSGNEVYKYDFLLGMWEERSSDYFNNVGKMIVLSGEMYAVTNSGELVKIEGTGYGAWSFATDAMTESTLSLKRLQKVRLTYELGADAEFSMLVVKSDGNELETVTRQNREEKTVLQRCEFSLTNAVDWFLKLRFKGEGYFKLISMDVEIKGGGAPTYE